MSKVVISYGLNPLSGIRLLSEGSWSQAWGSLSRMFRHQKVQVSLGAIIPEHATLLDRMRDLTFFIALESPTPKSVPLLGSPTGIQIYQQDQGSQTYTTEVVRFAIGKNPIRRLPAYAEDAQEGTQSKTASSTDITLYH